MNLNVCNAWMIYKIGIISKRYLIMFGILRWHVQLIIVWSHIVHQVCFIARAWMIYNIGIIYKRYLLDSLIFQKNRYLIRNVWNFAVACATYYCLVIGCAPDTRDETKQGYLTRPVRDPEQGRAPAARGVRRGMHGMS